MTDIRVQSLGQLEQVGYALLAGMFDDDEMGSFAVRLSEALRDRHEPSILRSRGHTYGSRNLLATFPEVTTLLSVAPLRDFIIAVLGRDAGIVRVLFFDKPPDRSWSLPWHRDRTIAVKRNDLQSRRFCKPTVKAGVAHVEAPESLLAEMLTLRVHLDPMTEENGPLSVIPGSHHVDDKTARTPVALRANVGDVLVMRPLLSHSSNASQPDTTLHRRVIHLELAPSEKLPDGFEWYSFVPLA